MIVNITLVTLAVFLAVAELAGASNSRFTQRLGSIFGIVSASLAIIFIFIVTLSIAEILH